MDFTYVLRGVFGLAIVLGLIVGLAYVLRRYAPNLLARVAAPRGRKRLEVLETLVLDPTRRLVMVRVDDEERLVLLGEGRELTEIKPQAVAKPAEPRTETARPVAAKPVEPPRPAPQPIEAPRPRPVPAAAVAKAAQPAARPKLAAVRPQLQDPNDDLF